MYIIMMDEEIYNIVSEKYEIESALSGIDEATDIRVEEWKVNAGGWYYLGTHEYYIHDGIVGRNE